MLDHVSSSLCGDWSSTSSPLLRIVCPIRISGTGMWECRSRRWRVCPRVVAGEGTAQGRRRLRSMPRQVRSKAMNGAQGCRERRRLLCLSSTRGHGGIDGRRSETVIRIHSWEGIPGVSSDTDGGRVVKLGSPVARRDPDDGDVPVGERCDKCWTIEYCKAPSKRAYTLPDGMVNFWRRQV